MRENSHPLSTLPQGWVPILISECITDKLPFTKSRFSDAHFRDEDTES